MHNIRNIIEGKICFEGEIAYKYSKNVLTVTNWLFSSLMMSPTWTSSHFSLRSLKTGNRLLSGCLDSALCSSEKMHYFPFPSGQLKNKTSINKH